MNVCAYPQEPSRVLSLCAGVGGLDLAVRLVFPRAYTALYVERETYCVSVLASRMEDEALHPAPVWSDLCTLDTKPLHGVVDFLIGGFPCFVAGTFVLSREGYKRIEDIKIGDEVLTHLGRWRKVNAVMSREGAKLRRIRAGGVPELITTDEHPFYSRSQYYTYGGRGKSPIRNFSDPQWVEAKYLSDEFISQTLPPIEENEFSKDFWWLVGRWLADGWVIDRKTRGIGIRESSTPVGKVYICCAYEEFQELAERIRAAGFHATQDNDRTTVKFIISNGEFWNFLKQFGKGAGGKTIPGIALGLDQEKSRALLDGYISGDGCLEKSSIRIGSISQSLALGVALLAQRAYGVVAGVRIYNPTATKIIEGRTVNQKTRYVVDIPFSNTSPFIDGNYGWKRVKENSDYGFGKVYNIGVEEDESYMANGAIVHNCQPASLSGKRLGNLDERWLWPEFMRCISDIRPRYVFVENVAGLLSKGAKEVLGDMSSMGYDGVWGIFSCGSLGANHLRKRFFTLFWDPTQIQLDANGQFCHDSGSSPSDSSGQQSESSEVFRITLGSNSESIDRAYGAAERERQRRYHGSESGMGSNPQRPTSRGTEPKERDSHSQPLQEGQNLESNSDRKPRREQQIREPGIIYPPEHRDCSQELESYSYCSRLQIWDELQSIVRLEEGVSVLESNSNGQRIGSADDARESNPHQNSEEFIRSNPDIIPILWRARERIYETCRGVVGMGSDSLCPKHPQLQEQPAPQCAPSPGSSFPSVWAPRLESDFSAINPNFWPRRPRRSAQPRIRGVDDGVPAQLDKPRREPRNTFSPVTERLRALGNAVSPPQGAVALTILWGRMIKILRG